MHEPIPNDTKTARWKSRGQPVEYKGVVYPTSAALARKLGVSASLVTRHLNNHGHLQYLGVGTGRGRKSPATGKRLKPINLFGREFPSITAAAEYLGVPRSTLYMRLRRAGPSTAELMLRDLQRADEREAKAAEASRRAEWQAKLAAAKLERRRARERARKEGALVC